MNPTHKNHKHVTRILCTRIESLPRVDHRPNGVFSPGPDPDPRPGPLPRPPHPGPDPLPRPLPSDPHPHPDPRIATHILAHLGTHLGMRVATA